MKEVLPETGLSTWLQGVYEIEVKLNLPAGVVNTPVKVKIEVKKKS